MKTYETSATVEDQGRVLLDGVPFAPGTEVEVTISPKVSAGRKVTPPQAQAVAAGLRFEGNVLVHQGIGAGTSITELREERLNRLGQEQAG